MPDVSEEGCTCTLLICLCPDLCLCTCLMSECNESSLRINLTVYDAMHWIMSSHLHNDKVIWNFVSWLLCWALSNLLASQDALWKVLAHDSLVPQLNPPKNQEAPAKETVSAKVWNHVFAKIRIRERTKLNYVFILGGELHGNISKQVNPVKFILRMFFCDIFSFRQVLFPFKIQNMTLFIREH